MFLQGGRVRRLLGRLVCVAQRRCGGQENRAPARGTARRPRPHDHGLQPAGDQHAAGHARSDRRRRVAGLGVTVAVIDSGIYPSAAFAGRIKAFYDFTRRARSLKARAYDDYGHGTHVAGLIGGSRALADLEYEGVAPGVQFVGLKVLDENGGGQHQRRHPRDRVRDREQEERSASTSSTCRSATRSSSRPRPTRWCRRSRRPSKAGIIVVASAGNHGVNETRRDWLRRHHVAGQRAVGDDRRRRGSQGDGDSRRRSHGRLQLERSDVVRRSRQA